MGAAQNCSASVNRAFYKAFYNWGHFIGRCPFLVIVLSGLLGVLGGIRLPLATRFPIESVIEQEDLWVPQQAQAVTDKARYDAIFTNAFRRNTIYFTTKPRGGNVLTSSILAEVRRFDRMVTEGINASGYGTQRTERLARTYTALHDSDLNPAVEYNDVCARSTIPIGRNLSDPDDEGGIPCILFGHPLEIFYRIGGGTPRDPLWLPGDFNFDFTVRTRHQHPPPAPFSSSSTHLLAHSSHTSHHNPSHFCHTHTPSLFTGRRDQHHAHFGQGTGHDTLP